MKDKELFERFATKLERVGKGNGGAVVWNKAKYVAAYENVLREFAAALREREHVVDPMRFTGITVRCFGVVPLNTIWVSQDVWDRMKAEPATPTPSGAIEVDAADKWGGINLWGNKPATQPTPQPSTEAAKELDDAIRAVYEFRPERDIPGESHPESGQ